MKTASHASSGSHDHFNGPSGGAWRVLFGWLVAVALPVAAWCVLSTPLVFHPLGLMGWLLFAGSLVPVAWLWLCRGLGRGPGAWIVPGLLLVVLGVFWLAWPRYLETREQEVVRSFSLTCIGEAGCCRISDGASDESAPVSSVPLPRGLFAVFRKLNPRGLELNRTHWRALLSSPDGLAGFDRLEDLVLRDPPEQVWRGFDPKLRLRRLKICRGSTRGVDFVLRQPCMATLERLDLRGCRYVESIPALAGLEELEWLNLRQCKRLSVLPYADRLTRLRFLGLVECSALEELPDLSELQELRWLYLSRDALLPRVTGLEKLGKLWSLDLSQCSGMMEWPDLSNLKELELLCLTGGPAHRGLRWQLAAGCVIKP